MLKRSGLATMCRVEYFYYQKISTEVRQNTQSCLYCFLLFYAGQNNSGRKREKTDTCRMRVENIHFLSFTSIQDISQS